MPSFTFIILIAISVKTFDCTKESRPFGRIVRGHDAAIDQFPYAVKMDLKTRTDTFICGAALIAKSWLLTAAHCFAETESVTVHLGYATSKTPERTYNVAPSDIKQHPKYAMDPFSNDIALVKIPRTELSEKIAIVPLPKKRRANDRYEDAYAIACGWGLTSTHASFPPTCMQYGRLQVLNQKDCLRMSTPFIKKNCKNVICTAMRSDLASICFGDSGGPLVLEETGELIGIASLVDANCENGDAPVFTRVASYLDWIRTIAGVSY